MKLAPHRLSPVPCRVAGAAGLLLLCTLGAPAPLRGAGSDAELFRWRYRQILTAYAAGEREGALAELTGLEREASLSGGGKGLEQIGRVELQVARDLLGGGPEVLVPVCLLHHDALVDYRDRGPARLARHSWMMAAELAELYARRAADRGADRTAAGLLASLAVYLQQGHQVVASISLYQRALERDAANEIALLGSAMIYEKRGRYDDALTYLERLVRAAPGNAHGRLRLAVQLRRLGRRSEALAELRRLLDSDPEAWILSLAYQELGGMLLEQGALAEARRTFSEGLATLPGDPTLPILLAYAADRDPGALPDGFNLAPELLQGAEGTDLPARARYNTFRQFRDPGLESMRTELRSRATDRLPLLARTLAALSPELAP